MDVVSRCPLRVTSCTGPTLRHGWVITVVCKATYTLRPGLSPLASDQEEPDLVESYWDDDPRGSVYSPSDMAPFKDGADILLVGAAYAPGSAPAASIVTRLQVGDVDKRIEASRDRFWGPDGALVAGRRVTRVPLRYERAAGGAGTANPVGIPQNAARDVYGRVPLPNLRRAGGAPLQRGDVIEPIGYGPIASRWPTRQAYLRSLPSSWDPDAWHQSPLPDEVEPAFFNAAPVDQRVRELAVNPRIVLENLHPVHPRLVTELVPIQLCVRIERPSGRCEAIRVVPDTLWIDTSRGICTLVWRGRAALAHRFEEGQVVVGFDDPPEFSEQNQTAPVVLADPRWPFVSPDEPYR